MATSTGQMHCAKCSTRKTTFKCDGCLRYFSHDHLNEHLQELREELTKIENERNEFRQLVTDQTENPQQHSLFQRIDKWEQESIKIIRKTASEAKQSLLQHTTGHVKTIEVKLAELTKQLEQTRKEDDFNETHLEELKRKLRELAANLGIPSNISIEEQSSSFIKKLTVVISNSKCTT